MELPLYYLATSSKYLVIKCRLDGKIHFRFSNSEKGHLAAAKAMRYLEKSQNEIHQLLLFWCPQHVKDQLNGKTSIQSESVRSEASGTG